MPPRFSKAGRFCSWIRTSSRPAAKRSWEFGAPHQHDLSGTHDGPQSGLHRRQPADRGFPRAPRPGRTEARQSSIDMLAKVGVPFRSAESGIPVSALRRHAATGHDRHGVACRPALLLADEPTTALDVSIQAQILDLMMALKSELTPPFCSSPMISEWWPRSPGGWPSCTPAESWRGPDRRPLRPPPASLHARIAGLHPPCGRLLRDREPERDQGGCAQRGGLPPGCHFEPRCPEAMDICRTQAPSLEDIRPGHRVACWRAAMLSCWRCATW